jgi:hypothetical protein
MSVQRTTVQLVHRAGEVLLLFRTMFGHYAPAGPAGAAPAAGAPIEGVNGAGEPDVLSAPSPALGVPA